MKLTRLAVDRPIATLMACLVVIILGVVSVAMLSVDLMPSVEMPTASVTTLYPGAGPEEIETLITRPLEQSLTSVPGFERVTSRSLEGSSNIQLEFAWGTDLDAAVSDMRQAIDRVMRELPEDCDPPTVRRYDSNDSPIIYMGVTSKLSPVDLTRLVEKTVIPRFERLPGAARVGMRGDVRREIHVEVDKGKVESLQIGLNEVVDALSRGNINRPTGDFQEGERSPPDPQPERIRQPGGDPRPGHPPVRRCLDPSSRCRHGRRQPRADHPADPRERRAGHDGLCLQTVGRQRHRRQ
jgi:HAE1 family hydrophobic/amphiphilic exporter-1